MDINEDIIFKQSEEDGADAPVRSGVKVWIRRRKNGLGPGGYKLLIAIGKNGSVKKGCAEAGVSYSKGWSIIHAAEEELGFAIVERQQGGAGGGEAHLTEKGKKLIELYEIYRSKVSESAKGIFSEVFGGSGRFD